VAVDVLIVGAGLSGLMAAHTLQDRGYTVQLIDKGRSVGGRLATRRVGDGGLADHGAQFFTVRTDTLRGYVEKWLADDVVYVWGTGWSDGSLKKTAGDGHPRYVAHGGMNKLAKYIAQGLDIVLHRRITSIQLANNTWTILDEDGEAYNGRALLLTPPMPQSLDLLDHSNVKLDAADLSDLQKIQFGPCLCGIHAIDGELNLPEPGAVQNFEHDVYWVADNQAKGISKQVVVTSHASAKFSRQNWDTPEADVIAELESAVMPFLTEGSQIVSTQLKKWRYSVPLTTYPQEYLLAQGLPNLAFAGDAFGGRGRIEGAFKSGIAAAEALIDSLE
jgi:predicted NAD/FAD-dependent oxidoreductase